MSKTNRRPDHTAGHRAAFEKNRKRIFATQTVCGICGRPVDFSIPPPLDWSPCIDHIIPISKGGHPSDISNLQLAHNICNRQKSAKIPKLTADQQEKKYEIPASAFTGSPNARAAAARGLPWSTNWDAYISDTDE